MRVLRSLEKAGGHFRRPVVTIGNFDGVHRGHQVILDQVVDDAKHRGVDAVVLTFDPHPVAVIRPDAAPIRLMTLADRLRHLGQCGVSATVVQRFNQQFAAITAEDFVSRFLVGRLDAQKLIVGHDLNYGHRRAGSVETLVDAGSRFGFAVEVIRPVQAEGILVHSSVVRETVMRGDMRLACGLLGRPHLVRGRVVQGAQRGKTLGFATANIRPRTEMVPPEGVYATRLEMRGRRYDGVTSIGRNETFGGRDVVIECHLFDDLDDFYGEPVALAFYDLIRGQRKFSGPEELVAQINADVDAAQRVLAELPDS